MGRQNIYKTLSVGSVMPPPVIHDVIDFLVTNRAHLFSNEKRTEAFKTRSFSHTVMSDIVHRITLSGKDAPYALIKIPAKTVSLCEAIDMTFIPFDLLQMKEITQSTTKTLSLLPELNDKIIINVTDITKASGDFSDITQFHNRIVRDFLSRSFYLSSGNSWISPTLVRYVAKVYSMTIGGQLARFYNLQYGAQNFVQSVFCAFFVCKMTSLEVTPAFMKAHSRFLGLGDASVLNQILAFIADTLGKGAPESIEEVCQVIDAYDHGQLKTSAGSRLGRPFLNMRFSSLAPEGHVSTIALEYPPYFFYLILLVLANVRIGLSFHMKSLNLIKEGQDVIEQSLHAPSFFDGL